MISFYYSRPELGPAFEDVIAPLISFNPVSYKDLPRTADYVLTRGQLTAQIERFASRLGAPPVVVPEGGPWLTDKISAAIKTDSDLVIVGYDVARP